MTVRRSTRVALAGAAALSLLSLASCANNSSTATSAPAASGVSLVNPGKLTVCTHLAYKPFQYKDTSGKIVGFDVDLMDVVAKKLNVTQEIVDIEFGQITSGAVFAAKKCDAGAAAITITDKRKEQISFAGPYFVTGQGLLVAAGNDKITGKDSLTAEDIVCSATGSTRAACAWSTPRSCTASTCARSPSGAARTGRSRRGSRPTSG